MKLSIDENDKMMISYWQELLISLLTRVPKPAQELKEQVDFQNDHNIMNIKNDTSNTVHLFIRYIFDVFFIAL